MSLKFKKIARNTWPLLLFFAITLILAESAHAQSYLGDQWDQFLGGLPTFQDQTLAGEEVAINIIVRAIGTVKLIMGAIALLLGIIYAMGLVFSRGKEEQLNKQKQNFLYVFVGLVLLMIADPLAKVFIADEATSDRLINFGAAHDQLRQITSYIKWLFGSILLLLMTISGVRMITAGGEEEVITKEKRNLTWSGIGMMVVLLASNIVNAIYVVRQPLGEPTIAGAPVVADTGVGILEIASITRLILVFLSPIAVLFTIYAGFLYLGALDNEERANKARRLITSGVTAIAVIFAAYALVNTFIGTPDTGLVEVINEQPLP